MKIAIMALTKEGSQLAVKLSERIKCDIFLRDAFAVSGNHCRLDRPLKEIVREYWHLYDAIVFIMAAGIVVRTIAPFLQMKEKDPAVVVMDENGRFVISLLSGHLGGANELSVRLSSFTGGQAVITTSSDLNGVASFDEIARKNGLIVENPENMQYISSAQLSGAQVYLYTQLEIDGALPPNICRMSMLELLKLPYKSPVVMVTSFDAADDSSSIYSKILSRHRVLLMRPRNIVVGSGCKANVLSETYEETILTLLKENQFSPLSLKCLATAELKANEKCMLNFCQKYDIPFKTYSFDMIATVESSFSSSDFVREIVGVGNVADCCAMLEAGSIPIIAKSNLGGITVAVSISGEKMKV